MSLPHTSQLTILKTKAGGKFCTVFGWFCAVFAFMFIMAMVKDKSAGDVKADGGITAGYIGLASGIGLILYGFKTKRLLKRFESYIAVILNRYEKSIENIANAVSRPPDFVLKDLRAMIGKKFFTDAFIDVYTSEIILRDMVYRRLETKEAAKEPAEEESADLPENKAVSPRPESAVVNCKGCGAANKVTKGTVIPCEFCGSPVTF